MIVVFLSILVASDKSYQTELILEKALNEIRVLGSHDSFPTNSTLGQASLPTFLSSLYWELDDS